MQIQVLIPLPIEKTFSYLYSNEISTGTYVEIDFSNKKIIGIVTKFYQNKFIKKDLKNIKNVIKFPKCTPQYLQFIQWISNYYIIPIGRILQNAGIPKVILPIKFYKLKKSYKLLNLHFEKNHILDVYTLLNIKNFSEKKLVKLIQSKHLEPTNSTETQKTYNYKKGINLNEEQQKIFSELKKNYTAFGTFLLDGITGSGKTEVFLSLIEEIIIQKDKIQILILLPEISLNTELFTRIKQYFSKDIEILIWNSDILTKQKFTNWHKIHYPKKQIIIGTRSAIFLPYQNLQLIVIDEEHDTSFKEDEGKYAFNARDIAIKKAQIENIPIILSSATPSLETFHNAKNKKYFHLKLTSRFKKVSLPHVKIIDMKKAKLQNQYFSNILLQKIQTHLDQKQQILIFLNKKGYAASLICTNCGFKIMCQNCSTNLVYYKSLNTLLCHICGFSISKLQTNCIKCESINSIKQFNYGIEKITQLLKEKFPNAKITELTSNTFNKQQIIENIHKGKIDIMVGTQILAKGYHFPNLNMAAIIDADSMQNSIDLRAQEKAFQLFQQVIGRSGREKEGEVIIQTFNPESNFIQNLQKHDRDDFYRNELSNRKQSQMPPFYKIAAIIFSDYQQETLKFNIQNILKQISFTKEVTVYGPIPSPIFMIKKKYRYRLLLSSEKSSQLNKFIKKIIPILNFQKKLEYKIDIDPINFY